MFYKLVLAAVLLTAAVVASAQTGTSLRLTVKNKDTGAAIADAEVSIKGTSITGTTGANGVVELTGIPDGEQTIEIVSHGYEETEITLTFPLATIDQTVSLELHNEVGSVTVNSTRTGREIESEPTRVEAIDEEELGEKMNMRPSNVSMVLHESTGIQVQQTSATTNTQSIRIQGLDGRYTQILKDGFPAYGGFSGSLSVLEIPPLDLKQVEVIKGPSATLFGGDAIAGVVNFISKEPEEKPVTTIMFNQTSAGGTDISVFNSRKFNKFGYTLLGSTNFQRPYDVDDDDFTELPRTRSFAINPRGFFYIDDKTTLSIGNSLSYQTRKGGDIFVVRGEADANHTYFEQNDSLRNITTINFDRTFDSGSRLNAKQSLAFFRRDLQTPGYQFKGSQFNSFTDVSYLTVIGKHALVFGGSAVHDHFSEDVNSASPAPRDETRTTIGAFVQDTVDVTEKFSVEAGFRVDHAKNFGTFALPRVSLLYRLSENWSTRLGVGFGYKTPTIFNEDSERLLFRNLLPVGDDLDAERSRGGTFDVNYRRQFGEVNVSLNQMFFYTQITDPIVLRSLGKGTFAYLNADSSVISRGFETNLRVGYGLAKLFAGYTFTDAKAGYLPGDQRLTLTPRSRVNSSLVFEEHENFKLGGEFYFQSRQTLEDRSRTRSTAEFGLFAEKTFGKFSLFINAENITDVRQSKFSPVVIPPHTDPTFAELWTHTEGRVFNGGVKIRL